MAWTIPWLLAAFLPVLLTQGSTAQDENLLINGGFEDGTVDWVPFRGELTAGDALVHGGSHAGVFTADSTYAEVRSHCLLVAPSSDYQFWGYAASREGDPRSRLHLDISWHDGANCSGFESGGAGVQGSVALEEPGEWYELRVSGRSGANARAARVRIVVEASDTSVYLDDFAVAGPAAPTETPTPEPSASASPTRTTVPHFTPTPEPPTPSPSATPRISPTASSWQRTPVPVQGALRNGGFEDVGSGGRPSFWQKYGGELARTNSEHFEGQFAAALSSQTSSTKWAYQIVTVQGGKAYLLSAYALKADPAVAAAYLRLSWYASPDGSGQAIDSADSTEHLTDGSPGFRFLTTGAVVAPAEAASAKARLMLDPAGEAPGTTYFDAVTFEETALPEPTPSPTATPRPVDDEQTPTPPSPTVTGSAVASTSEPRRAPAPAGGATTPRPSPTGVDGAGKPTPAVLGAARGPVATATAAAAATRVPASVYRQRKSDSSVGGGAAARAGSVGGGLSPQLLALAAGVPALAGAGAGVYYWRWRRARLR
jgi:hypothetical protein